MNVALIGSVSSSYHALDALIQAGVEITCVCGVDPARAGRIGDYHDLGPLARAADVPYLPFVKVGEDKVAAFLRMHPPELLWVIGLSQLVPQKIIEIGRQGGIGFHPTMLPEGRGRAPVAWTILRQARAAVSLFFLAEEADAGDLIAQREVSVLPDDYSEDLIARTNKVLREVIADLAPAILEGNLERRPQDHARATFYEKRTPADGLIDWSQPTEQVYRLIRAAGRPYPGAFAYCGAEKVVLWRARPAESEAVSSVSHLSPGSIIQPAADCEPLVRTKDGALWITDWGFEPRITGRPLAAGDRLSHQPAEDTSSSQGASA